MIYQSDNQEIILKVSNKVFSTSLCQVKGLVNKRRYLNLLNLYKNKL